jgi:hypothetical protein
MHYKLLHLKKARNYLASDLSVKIKNPDRRNFIRTLGLGILAWNPLTETLKSIAEDPFEIKCRNNCFSVMRNGKVAWEITDNFFEKGYHLKYTPEPGKHQLVVNGLKVRNTPMDFSMQATIFQESGRWKMNLNIPELAVSEKVDFLDWLDKNNKVRSNYGFDKKVIGLNQYDCIVWEGICSVNINSSWEISIEGLQQIQLDLNNERYRTNQITIQPFQGNSISFFRSIPAKSVKVTVPEFSAWNDYISRISFDEGNQISASGDMPELNFVLGKSENVARNIFWVAQREGHLVYKPYRDSVEKFSLDRYIYFSEYYDNRSPEFYLAGKFHNEGQWFGSKIGSFKFINDNRYPVFEAFGEQNRVNGHVFEPRMQAFQPIIIGAVSMPTYFEEPLLVQVNTSQKENNPAPVLSFPGNDELKTVYQEPPGKAKQIQRPVNTDKVTQLKISYDEIKLIPKRAIKINILRPEDLIALEFEFYNFNFSNEGNGSYLQLDNKEEKGTMVVFFPSQHTLEEAWFETSKVPTYESKDDSIALPARQIRARKSRLVYELEAGNKGFPLMMEEMLDWSKFELRVHPRAWIKLGTIFKPGKYKISKNIPVATSSPSIKYLDKEKGSVEYNIRLAQNNKVRLQNEMVYQPVAFDRMVRKEKSFTIQSTFNVLSLPKFNFKVGPVPDSSTSIEAPALMYISPNQMNDFVHKIKLDLRDTDEQKIGDRVISAQTRVFDPLSTSKGEIAELWHTKLGVKLKDAKTSVLGLQDLKTIRVLWSDDATETYDDKVSRNVPFMASLDANNRHKLVHTTSNYSIDGFTPIPVPVRKLMLTSLGAYLDWHVFFDVPTPVDTALNIIEWEHIANLGRDHYVKIVEEGYLFPFGHRAAVVKITERKFHKPTKAALNRQRMYIVVLEKEVLYSRNDPNGKFIEFPFQEVRIDTAYTPDIDNPEGDSNNPKGSTLVNVPPTPPKNSFIRLFRGVPGKNTTYNFYIRVGGQGFNFDIVATDKEGFGHKIQMPLVFLENSIARDYNLMGEVINIYNADEGHYAQTNLWEQKIAYAESLVDGDTAFETESIFFGGQQYPAKEVGSIQFHPRIQSAQIYLKQVEDLTGVKKPAQISLEDDNNAGHVFAKVSNAVVDFTGGSDKSGGFLSPNMAVNALSKLQGPVGGSIDDIKNLVFKANDFFKEMTDFPVAKIFGVIDIFSLLLDVDLGGSFDSFIAAVKDIKKEIEEIKNEILYLENLAKDTAEDTKGQINNLKTQIASKVKDLLDSLNSSVPKMPNFKTYFTEEAFYAEYKWQPELQGTSIEVIPSLLNVNVTDPKTALSVTTKFEKPFDSSKSASLNGSARFEKFGIDIVPLLAVNFNYLEFKSGSSQKTDIKVDINPDKPIEFKGALSFVNNLQSLIPSTGFSGDGPYIEIKPTGVTAGFDISVPSVTVGICMIANISLGASITLPFTGAPLTLGFNFCKRENPFMLTISCFGGGGFFMLVTTLHGIQSIEAAFEFGAAMALNVGVASGGVSAMGGIYFKLELKTQNVNGKNIDVTDITLTGYLRINGHLSILGLITVSLEFYLAFTALFETIDGKNKVQKLEGEATLKVKVEVLFFSKTVSVTVRRELKGADADPKFYQMIDTDDWNEYCLAFAS